MTRKEALRWNLDNQQVSIQQVSTYCRVADHSCRMLGQTFTFVAQVPALATEDDVSEEESAPLTDRQKKDIRNARDKARRKEKRKAEAFMAGLGGEDSEEGAPKKKKKVKKPAAKEKGTKAKKTVELWDDSEDEDDDPPKKFTVYLDIEGPKVAAAGGSHSKSAPPPLTIKRGPFFHETNQSFAAFKKSIGAVTPCNPEMIVLNSLVWKFETPMGGPRRPLPNEVGYEAMIGAVREKKGASVIFVYMPPPKKDLASSPPMINLGF